MNRRRQTSGHTFVELVLAIAVLGLAIPAFLSLFSEVTVSGTQGEMLPTTTALATELLEEIRSRRFDELSEKNGQGNWSPTLGPEGGEAGKAGFDDVDDFNGWAQNFGAGFTNYTATVLVSYVAANDLNIPLVVPFPLPDNWTPSYKRIVVTLAHPNLTQPQQFVTVVTEVQSL